MCELTLTFSRKDITMGRPCLAKLYMYMQVVHRADRFVALLSGEMQHCIGSVLCTTIRGIIMNQDTSINALENSDCLNGQRSRYMYMHLYLSGKTLHGQND